MIRRQAYDSTYLVIPNDHTDTFTMCANTTSLGCSGFEDVAICLVIGPRS